MEDFEQQIDSSGQPAYLVALDAGFSYREYPITAPGVTIGRDAGLCDIVVAGAKVSRRHVRICTENSRSFFLEDLESTNGVFLNGNKVIGSAALHDGDVIGLGFGDQDALRFQIRSSRSIRQFTLPAQQQWVIGRAPDCDLPLPFEPTVSSHHAILAQSEGGVTIVDNHSLNGTWVNGGAPQKRPLTLADTVVIGSTHFCFQLGTTGALTVHQREYGQSVKLECVGLTRTAPHGRKANKLLLDDITLTLEPGEFVGILGPSGAGKTTLLTALNGFNRPERGQVLLNETPLDSAYEMFRHTIGYVPQDDLLHSELTV